MYLLLQIPTHQEPIDYNQGPCEISRSDMTTREVSWGSDVSGNGWISGEFAVSKLESEETGTTAACESNEGTRIVCIWWRTAHT